MTDKKAGFNFGSRPTSKFPPLWGTRRRGNLIPERQTATILCQTNSCHPW